MQIESCFYDFAVSLFADFIYTLRNIFESQSIQILIADLVSFG